MKAGKSLFLLGGALLIGGAALAQNQGPVATKTAATASGPAEPSAETVRGWAETYLQSRYDNSMKNWTTVEWGPIEHRQPGKLVMRYKYQQTNAAGKKLTTYMDFTFTPDGKWLGTLTMQGLRVEEGSKATVLWRADKDGKFDLDAARTVTITDTALLERLAHCFPDAGTAKTRASEGLWMAGVEISFMRPNNNQPVHVVVNPELTQWSEGSGEFALAGDLKKELEAIKWDAPAATAAVVAEPWGKPKGGVQVRLHPGNSVQLSQ